MSTTKCPWCDGQLKPEASKRFFFSPDEGPDAWAGALHCLSCGAIGPWAKGDTRDGAIASAEYRAQTLLRHLETQRRAQGGPNLQNFPYSEKEVPRINRQDFFTKCDRSATSTETEDK